ncbi:hypothetical protein CVS40_6871 [Lucilia cuprina]|nr:hypothetical protein CVS40_6871 [Lucilia cuprina]
MIEKRLRKSNFNFNYPLQFICMASLIKRRQLKKQSSQEVKDGLDPRFFIRKMAARIDRLIPKRCSIVDIIHTDGGFWVILKQWCSSDFYPNGGRCLQLVLLPAG